MNHKMLNTYLTQRAEELASDNTINLWPEIQENLSSRLSIVAAKSGRSKIKSHKPIFVTLSTIVFVLAMTILVFAATPQGRAAAQQFLSLFFHTAPDVRPFDSNDVPAVVNLQESIQQVETMLGWKVFTPSWLPDGYKLSRVEYRPKNELVSQTIVYEPEMGMHAAYFYLGQRKTPFTDLWPVGESAKIETVQIGSITGEYVVGVWGGAVDHLEWEKNPAFQTLRWQANGYYFEIQYSIWGFEENEYPKNPYYLSEEQLIHIADKLQ
jgi:hypothetical protein